MWCAKQTTDRGQPSIQMIFLLPLEFRAPADQEVYSDFDESKYEEIVVKLTVTQQAIFDKPVNHQHLKALYVKGFINGKSMSKMLMDGVLLLILCLILLFTSLARDQEI